MEVALNIVITITAISLFIVVLSSIILHIALRKKFSAISYDLWHEQLNNHPNLKNISLSTNYLQKSWVFGAFSVYFLPYFLMYKYAGKMKREDFLC